MKNKADKKGFTLIEMLVVIGIIGILSGALLMGYGSITKSAQRTRAQETVSNVATALNILLQRKGTWPAVIIGKHGKDGSGMGCVEEVAKEFAKNSLLGISYDSDAGKLTGSDRCGIVDPWAVAVLKRNKNGKATTKVPSGGTVESHIIYYAIDEDMDGITEAQVCGSEKIRVRASAIAWCAGADGELGETYSKKSKANSDNVYSWRRAQEVKK